MLESPTNRFNEKRLNMKLAVTNSIWIFDFHTLSLYFLSNGCVTPAIDSIFDWFMYLIDVLMQDLSVTKTAQGLKYSSRLICIAIIPSQLSSMGPGNRKFLVYASIPRWTCRIFVCGKFGYVSLRAYYAQHRLFVFTPVKRHLHPWFAIITANKPIECSVFVH